MVVLKHMAQEIHDMQCLTGDALQGWWASLSSTWCWVFLCIGGAACTPVVCYSLYCCCGMWMQVLVVCARK